MTVPNLELLTEKSRAVATYSDRPGELHARMYAAAEAKGIRLAWVELESVPPITTLNRGLLQSVGELALLTWPEWDVEEGTLTTTDLPAGAVDWWRTASRLARRGQPPLVSGISTAVQLRWLRRLVSAEDLLVVISAVGTKPARGRLLGLSRSAEWLAREAAATVLVICPLAWMGDPELDSFAACDPLVLGGLPVPDSPGGPPSEEAKRVGPIGGRPHPGSPGEQLLADHLRRDLDLGKLFTFNHPVECRLGRRYLVDLIWPDGKVVVEVDGYGWHTIREVFHSDRLRDAELTLCGHLVLRLPHDEVIEDPHLAVERIREFVDYRRRHPPP